MSILTYTSSERAQETPTDYPPCCGQSPVKWTWRKKGFVAIACVSPTCENHQGVLGYGEKDALACWMQRRRDLEGTQ